LSAAELSSAAFALSRSFELEQSCPKIEESLRVFGQARAGTCSQEFSRRGGSKLSGSLQGVFAVVG